MEKIHYTYDDIHDLVARIAKQIAASSFQPQAMVAIGAGGFIPARILRTFLHIPIYTITAAYYDENDQAMDKPRTIQWLDGVEKKLRGKRVLLVDEVDDSRVTLEFCLQKLADDGIDDVGIAVLHHKNKAKKGKLPEHLPAYFSGLNIDDIWICYPWDAPDIHAHNIQAQHGANGTITQERLPETGR